MKFPLDYDPTEYSPIAYLDQYSVVNEKGERLSFDDRRFLYEPMADLSQYQVYKKCAQIGMSVTMVYKSHWCVKHEKWDIIHTFPSDSDSNEFVNTKTNEMIRQNGHLSIFETQSDNTHLKQIDGRFLYYKGTISKTAMIMTSADLLIADEYDRSNIPVVDAMDTRMQNSKFRGIWWLSNPSLEGAGVDAKWAMSDQKEWYVRCKNGHEHDLTWPDSVDMERRAYICKECGVVLDDEDRRMGEWIAEAPGAPISGYHISLMMAPWISAAYMVEKYDDGKNPEKFFNFLLGEPYSQGESKITRTMILDNWSPTYRYSPPYYLGVDVGNTKHFVLGTKDTIIRVGSFTEWEDLDDILERYKPTVFVIDALPEKDMSMYYKDKYQGAFANYFSEDKKSDRLIEYGEGDETGIIKSDRNRVIDRIVRDLLEGKIIYALPADRDFQEYLKHCSVMRRIKVTNSKGIERYIWEALDNAKSTSIGTPTKPDHYFFATIYWWIAKETMGTGAVLSEDPKKLDSILRTPAGFISRIHEALEESYEQGTDIS